MWDRLIRYARRLARNSVCRGRRESVPAGRGKVALLIGVWGATAIAAAPASSQPDLDRLMRLLAERRHGEVTYVEKDYLSLLERPLKSSGVLIYDAPDHLEKRTLQPRAESLVLDHGELTVTRGDRTYHLDLGTYPQAAPYVDAIRATMAGDLGALERVFSVRFQGSLAHWQLGLRPLDRKIARGVRSIRIDGAEAEVESVEIDKPNGDRSVMTMRAPATKAGAGAEGAPPPRSKPRAKDAPGPKEAPAPQGGGTNGSRRK
jgi:hypothetical protein